METGSTLGMRISEVRHVATTHPNYTVEGLTAKMRELHPYLVAMEQIVSEKKIPVREAFQDTQIGSFWVVR
jgi:hypothetical protein